MTAAYPAHEFSAENIRPFWLPQERHSDVMHELAEVKIFTASTGQHFSGLHVNRDFSSSTPLVRLGSWLSASTTPETKYTMYQYAAANPDRQILLVDMPSHGKSDNLTAQQWAETLKTKRISKVGSAQAEAVRAYLPESEDVITIGDSLGGCVTPDFARKAGSIGLKPLLIAGFDIAGADKQKSIRMAKAFFISETRRQHYYHEGAANLQLDNAYEEAFKTQLRHYGMSDAKYIPSDVYKRNPGLAIFLLARSPLASDKAFESIEETLTENSGTVAAFVSGGLSKICRWKNIKHRVENLQSRFGKRVSWDVWPEDSHSMSIAPQQPRFAAVTRAMIDNLTQS